MDGGRVIHFGRVDFRNDLKLGGLAFYGADRGEIFRRTAGYVDRILRGEKPYDSDSLDAELRKDGIEMIAPHRSNRSKPPSRNDSLNN
jgi:hypothetical protein